MATFTWPSMGSTGGVPVYSTIGSFPSGSNIGDLAVAADTGFLYEWNGTSWVQIAGPGSALSLGNLDAQAGTAKGAALVSGVLSMQSASATVPGLVNITTQTFAGNKTFSGAISASNLSGTNTGDVTLGTPNGLSLVAQALSLGLSSTSTTGALSSTDWNTFNNKQAALTLPLSTSNGGTGTGTTFTAGSVVFADGGGIYAQDNANFFWDDSNNRLGIGTAVPTQTLTLGNGADQTIAVLDSTTSSAVAGRSLTIKSGTGDSTGAGTAAGNIAINAGSAQGDNTQSNAGGNVSLVAGASKGSSNGGGISLTGGTGAAGTGTAGSNGGTITLTAGTAGLGSATGGNGGGLTMQGGASAAKDGSAGGSVTITGRAGTSTGTGGNGGGVSLTAGSAGGSGATNRSGASISLSAGSSKGNTIGGPITLTAGDADSTTSSAATVGGTITITGGVGSGSGAAAGGIGGGNTIVGGAGGVGSATSGVGGAITITGGIGGAGVAAGAGGGVTISAGAGAVGSSSAGNGGASTLQGGAAAAQVGSAGGAVTVSGRTGSTTGTGGAGGSASLLAGSAGGDETVNRAGGNITVTAGTSKGLSTGGTVTVTSGAGGIGTSTTGAAGGLFLIQGGAGGAGSSTGGAGAAVSIVAGTGGASTTGGVGGALNLRAGVQGAGGSAGGGSIIFQTAATTSLTTAMTIDNAQRVGIGVVSGGALLDVNGSTRIRGLTTAGPVQTDSSGNLSSTATLPVANGGTNAASFTAYSVICAGTTSTGTFQNVSGVGTSGQVLTSNGAAALPTWQPAASTGTQFNTFQNGAVTTSVGSNILTIALKQADGATNPSTGTAAVVVGMRSSTVTSNAYNARSITGALSQTLTVGTSLGITASALQPIWFYLIDSDGAGTMKLGASSVFYDERSLQTTIAESFTGTVTIASPGVWTATAHGLLNGDTIQLTTSGALPTGLSTGTNYFVVSTAANTFNLALTKGGTAINTTGTQSGTHKIHIANGRLVSDAVYTNIPIRVVGKGIFNLSTPGSYSSNATELDFPRTTAGPKVFCYVQGSGATSIANGSFVTVPLTNLVNDLWNMSDGNGQMTLPFGGLWQFQAAVEFAANIVGGRGVIVNVGGAGYSNTIQAAGTPDVTQVNYSITLYVPSGTTFLMQAFQRSGGSLNAGSSDGASWASATLLAAY